METTIVVALGLEVAVAEEIGSQVKDRQFKRHLSGDYFREFSGDGSENVLHRCIIVGNVSVLYVSGTNMDYRNLRWLFDAIVILLLLLATAFVFSTLQ